MVIVMKEKSAYSEKGYADFNRMEESGYFAKKSNFLDV